MSFENTARKPGGYIIMADLNGDIIEQDTVMCCHCGNHWVVKPGSKKVRGWCTLCQKSHCGAKGCMECVPFEKRLDLYEKGKLLIL